VNFTLLAEWIETCDKDHDHDSEVLDAPHRRPVGMRYIDVRRRCIVKDIGNSPYAALSYTWGSQERCCLTRQNTQALEKEDSLRDSQFKLDATTLDAITVCERLAIPFLWIDALCIVQDDEQGKHDQIHNMDQIYADAYITLVAASENYKGTESTSSQGNVSSGLSRVSVPVASSQKSIVVDGVTYAVLPEEPCKALDLALSRSVWFTRGW
jgi:hypothetical protein